MRNTRNSLFTSAIALMLCIVMLAGTTFAWFTDLVTSNGNVIQAGKLSAQMHWSDELLDADSSEWLDASGQAVFTHDNWEPGYTDVKYIKVTNGGDLNFKWKLTVQADGPVTSLSDVIDVYYVNPVTSEITSLEGLTSVGTLTEVLLEKTNSTGRLTPGQSVILAIAFHMDDLAGNEYQNLSLCENGFSLKLLAAQDTGESDSFGDDYDADADWEEGSVNFTASASVSKVPMIYGALANDITIGASNGISATLPTGVKVADGATSLDLSVSQVNTDSNITLGEDDSARSLDVHISGIAADNTVPMIVNLGAILQPGLSDTELKLYHTENGTPVQMTRVNSVDDFAIHNQYTYNDQTGEVSIYVASFSVFSAVQTSAAVWDGTSDTTWYNENDTEFTLTTAEQFAGFRDLVDGGNTFAGKTVKLGVDIDLKNIPFDPIGFGYAHKGGQVFMGTFDGGNHTIYNLYENCWELDPDKTNYSTYTYSTAGAGLFASIKDATIKNLAISGAEIVFECVDMGIVVGYAQGTCHFENIIVTNSKIANYNRYTGGVVGEVSFGPYGIDKNQGYSHTFKNIVVDSTVKVCGLWGSFGCGMGGVIGGKWNDATVKMENVISAPVMDVYNDVVSAYQWYAFRGCGMLIGHTEEPYSDGRTAGNATASFLTCENVKVYYGDWVDYTYYQFANQTDAEGNRLWYSNYPWVRAEAGEYCDAFSNIRYGIPLINGVKVTELGEEEFNAAVTSSTKITFDQLYGADRGMYGTNEHEGVTVIRKNVKTVYIHNNENWTNLKLEYWYKNGEDTWTNLLESIDMSEMLLENDIYKIEVPIYAEGFKITADGENATIDFVLSTLEDGEHINLNGEHIHYFVDNNCVCGAVHQLAEYTFNLGEDGEAKHSDGGNAVTSYEENGFTLTLEEISSVYGNARDAEGNSCIKLGTGSLVGKLSFTVPENIDKVVLYIAGYKDNNATIEVNGVQHEITTLSNNGEYTAVVVDTSETKTVSLTTVEVMGEPRCMINAISFAITTVIEVHDCDENAEISAVDPNCTENGLTAGKACSICGKVMVKQETVPATGHTEETIPAVDATCTKNGLTKGTKCSVCEATLVEQETVPSTGHNYVEGTCSVCGEAFPTASGTYIYVFDDYTAGTQYAKGEEHVLDEYVTITTYDCHFTSELRIYSSNENNGYAIIHSVNPITTIGVNAGNKVDTINIYGSDDGVNWTTDPVATISVTNTSYNDYEASLNGEYKYLKLDVAGANQIRVKSMTLTTVPGCAHASTTENIVAPTCIEAGRIDTVCNSCGKVMSTVAGDPATGHLNTTTTTVDATCIEAGYITVTCDDCDAVISTKEIPVIAHTDVTTDNDHNCDVCGTENVTEHNYIDGSCDCGATEPTEPDPETPTESGWIKADLADIKSTDIVVIVLTTSGGKSYAISNDKGTSAAPTAVVVTVDGSKLTSDVADNIKWNISNNNGNLTIYPNGTTATWLYCTANNNGVRVGTNANKVFTIDSSSGYLKNSATSRFVGVYTTNPDIRCYTTSTTNIKDQTLAFYVYSEGASGGETPACEHTNTTTTTKDATCTEAGSTTVTCDDCGETVSTETLEATGHNYVDGACSSCGAEDPNAGGSTEPTVVLEITKGDFNSTSYAANNNTKTENGYSYTSYQVMNQSNVMQWQKSKGYITITSNEFVKLELKVTAGTYTVTVGGKTVAGTTSNGVTTYDLSGLTGEIKIAVSSSETGKVEYLKFYK